jgi:stress-induced morphogen
MPTAEEIRVNIEATLPGATVLVDDYTGTGDHFSAVVVSDRFTGLGRVEQHRLVYAAVADDLASGAIHALQLTTRTPEEQTQ